MQHNAAEIAALVKTAQTAVSDAIAKNFTQTANPTQGIQAYDLEAPSKKLYPLLTPLRNSIPRVGGGMSSQANWKAITAINTQRQRAGISEGNRGGSIQHNTAEYFAAYRGLGLEKFTTFEADYAGRGYEDTKALAVTQGLEALMIEEELTLLGGNNSLFLGVTPTPTLAASAGGSLAAGDLSVIAVALTTQAYWDVAGLNNGTTGVAFNAQSALRPVITRNNRDGSSDTFGGGVAQKSAAATVTVTAGQKVSAAVQAVRGAYGYAFYWGPAGAETLGGVSGTNVFTITAAATGAQLASALPASDNSVNTLEFDGILTMAGKTGLGSYFKSLDGAKLTGLGGRIVEIDVALANFFDLYRLSPDEIHVSSTVYKSMNDVILGQANPQVHYVVDVNAPTAVIAGRNVAMYMNPITGDMIKIIVHPNMPAGTLYFRTVKVPGYVDGVQNILQVKTRQEYYQIEWPRTSRKYEYGVYVDEVLQNYLPGSQGVITNIGT